MESAPGPKVSISIEKFRRLKEENAQLKEELALCHKYQNVPHGGGRKTRRGGYRIRWGRSIEKDFKPLDFVRGETYKIKLSNGRKKEGYVHAIVDASGDSYIQIDNRIDSPASDWDTILMRNITKIWKKRAMNPQEGGHRKRKKRKTRRKRRRRRRRTRRR